MSYQKFEVDNIVCARRFHFSFDDAAPPLAEVTAQCSYCGLTIFSATNHPAVRFARSENLIDTGELSPLLLRQCNLTDAFSAKTRHEPERFLYPEASTKKK